MICGAAFLSYQDEGFVEDSQKGSHPVLYDNATLKRVVVPVHAGKTVKKSLLKARVEGDAAITMERFFEEL